MADWETSGRIKIKRAEKHIEDLKAEIDGFRKRDAYEVIRDVDTQTGTLVIRVVVRQTPPLHWGAIAGDAAHSLRSALNVLWRMAVPRAIRDENRSDGFPILTAKKFKRRFEGKKPAALEPVVKILKLLKPYEGGNPLLWTLRVINDTDKHRMLIPVFAYPGGSYVKVTPKDGQPIIYSVSAPPIKAIEQDAELFRLPTPIQAGTEVDVDLEIALLIAFSEPEVLRGQQMLATLHNCAVAVEEIALLFGSFGLLT
jgi:hypothetical protein